MQTVWNFGYIGRVDSVQLPPGKYKFECWGACGGRLGADDWTECAKGGYTKGVITLKEKTTFHIYVGQSGYEKNLSAAIVLRTGFNGGGKTNLMGFDGYYYTRYGGGATDIRLVDGNWDNLQGLLSRIIVAGGGGGMQSTYDTSRPISYGGGHEGYNGIDSNANFSGGGSQFQGGASRDTEEYHSSFGKGGYGGYGVGGGGGWYGGAGSRYNGAAGGGSGYALTKDSYKPAGYTPTSKYYLSDIVMTTGGNTTKADGYAKITLLQALPLLTVSSYNSTQATFKADHTDPTLLTKIEYFIDDVLKETITTDLTLKKTINYTLEDNALHTLKIVVTDSNNATVEKVLTIGKGVAPLPAGSSSEEVTNKWMEIKDAFKTGKTSIINTLALKNIEASLNNTLAELSEKIKAGFDSGDASVQELQNRITELTNQLSQRKRWAKGTASLTISYVNNAVHQQIETNLSFRPSIILVKTNLFFTNSGFDSYNCNLYSANNLTETYAVNANKNTGPGRAGVYAQVVTISEESFILHFTTSLYFNVSQNSPIEWYAFE
ncbi:glycine rich domain-containing protein [Clostridioides difficile]|uniref:glycine rich domain-containing protein n=1 Tax=Clostridioides difficile TaxID=1496 RepID=UPI00115EE1D9|nr:glycine rich domain-containing protein [Clostridioides difficile]TQX30419.1 hypothetical protein D1N55_08865 [Clostridioides difficile]